MSSAPQIIPPHLISGRIGEPLPIPQDLEIGVPISSSSSSSSTEAIPYTLEEPVSVTILRDLKAIGRKIKYVLVLNHSTSTTSELANGGSNGSSLASELRDWDLWGPLVLCLALSVLLSWGVSTEQAGAVFALVFVFAIHQFHDLKQEKKKRERKLAEQKTENKNGPLNE